MSSRPMCVLTPICLSDVHVLMSASLKRLANLTSARDQLVPHNSAVSAHCIAPKFDSNMGARPFPGFFYLFWVPRGNPGKPG